jgi:hypothetical protein
MAAGRKHTQGAMTALIFPQCRHHHLFEGKSEISPSLLNRKAAKGAKF